VPLFIHCVSLYLAISPVYEGWKEAAQAAYYIAAIVAAAGALLTYIQNSRRERAKWAVQLYEKFYETQRYQEMRDRLDCKADCDEIRTLIEQEPSAFTDYLNFFELVTFLAESKQVPKSDVLRLFQYYLGCLKKRLLSRICGRTPVRGVVQACETGPFPWLYRFESRRIVW
jgi:uncharacterized protein YdiU (UPF0061 family)